MTTALDGSMLDATDFHGEDGLGNVHKHFPHHTAPEEWEALFSKAVETVKASLVTETRNQLPFVPSATPSYDEILRVLQEEPEDTVTIVALGPLMNVARAAAADPTTFARVRRVVSMGGTLRTPGNVTPYAEFNVFSDAQAAAAIYNLTGVTITNGAVLKGLDLTIFPLDITSQNFLAEPDYLAMLTARGLQPDPVDPRMLAPLTTENSPAKEVSPLLEWCHSWLMTTFDTMRHLFGHDLMTPAQRETAGPVVLEMHDPLALWYAIHADTTTNTTAGADWTIDTDLDIRVETTGEFTRGMTVYDTRGRTKRAEPTKNDHGRWLLESHGNSVNVARESPYHESEFGRILLETIFGSYQR
ncbi:hypothetical protein D0Z03_001602 [Geotrichum reessii]|nr:hypothetical protein D0Z03_001602 [Galactomyces reessii]